MKYFYYIINLLLTLKLTLSFIFLISFPEFTSAQFIGLDPEKSITQYTLKAWTIDDGLPSNAITNIIQSKKGYIWITTYGGVTKFDGVNFTNYTTKNCDALLTEAAKVICEDNYGIIWIGTQKGIVLIENNNLYRNKNLEILDNSNIESIFVDKKNRVWIGTSASGLFKYEANSLMRIDDLDKISTGAVYAIHEDNLGNIWIGTIKGELIKYKNGVFIPSDLHNSSEGIFSFYQNSKNIIWVCSSTGIYTIENDKLHKNPDIDIRFVESIIEDVNKNIWISSSSEGLFRYNTITHQTDHLSELNGLPNNRVLKIIFDNQGNLWGGSYRGGLFQITDGKFTCFSISEGLKSNVNTAILEYDENEFWVANEMGTIDIIKNGQISKLKTHNPIPSQEIKHLFKDSKGNVWISTYAGLLKLGKHEEKLFNINNGFPDNSIRKTFEDTDGNIWVATNRTGIHKINTDGSIKTLNTDNGLSTNYVMTVIQYKPDVIIAGTKKGINFIKNDSVIKQYSMADGLPDNMIFNLYKDKDDILWIATNSGVSRFENNLFANFTIESGLQTNNVFDIVEDNLGYFWMPGPKGIMKVFKQQLNDYAAGKISKIDYIFYDKSDGMKSSVCLGATESLKDTQGNLWFLTAGGIVQINPIENTTYTTLPPMFVEKVFTKDSTFHLQNIINIQSEKKRFFIEYTAIDLICPEKILFKYKLEPFEKEWIEAENKRIVSYTNIDPGNYEFKVRSTNHSGIWNEDYVSVKIKVLPAWYQTLLFKLALIVFVFGGMLLWNRSRINRIKRQRNSLKKQVEERTMELSNINAKLEEKQADLEIKQEEITTQAENLTNANIELEKHKEHLEQLVEERTLDLIKAKEKAEESDKLKSTFLANMSHEIRTPMNAIMGFSNLINDPQLTDEVKSEFSNHITLNCDTLLKLIDDIIDVSKIEADQLVIEQSNSSVIEIINELIQIFDQKKIFINKSQIKILTNIPDELKNISIYTDHFRLKQILINLIDNALKFTEIGTIEFGFNLEKDNNLRFYVKDIGIGMSENQQKEIFNRFSKIENRKKKFFRGAGLGLSISKSLVEMLGGKIWVESEEDRGSIFYFTIPFIELNKYENVEITHPYTKSNPFKWNNKTILIAEDEDSNFLYLEIILNKTGAKIVRAKDGIEAIRLCKEHKPDLILMDIKMPNMNGFEASREIKKTYPKIPIVAQTAFAMESDERLSLEAGCNSYLSKPIMANKLIEVLSTLLNCD